MNLLMRLRIWLSDLIYPGDEWDRKGYIGFNNNTITVARIHFDGVSTCAVAHGIVMYVTNGNQSPLDSMRVVATELDDCINAKPINREGRRIAMVSAQTGRSFEEISKMSPDDRVDLLADFYDSKRGVDDHE